MSDIHLSSPLPTHPESTPEAVQERDAMLARLRAMPADGVMPPEPSTATEEEKLARARASVPEGAGAEEEITGEEEETLRPAAAPLSRPKAAAPTVVDSLSRDAGKAEPRLVVKVKLGRLVKVTLQVHEVIVGDRFIHILMPGVTGWETPPRESKESAEFEELAIAVEFRDKVYQASGICECIKLPGSDRGLLSFVRVDDTPETQ